MKHATRLVSSIGALCLTLGVSGTATDAGATVPQSVFDPRFLDGAIVADWEAAPPPECWAPADVAASGGGTYSLKNATDACTGTLGLRPVEVWINANGRLWVDGRELSHAHTLDATGNVDTIMGNALADTAKTKAAIAAGFLLVDDAGAYKPSSITPGPVSRVRFQNSSIVADWTAAAPPECWTPPPDVPAPGAGTYTLRNATSSCVTALKLPRVAVSADAKGDLSIDKKRLSNAHTLDADGKVDPIAGAALADPTKTTPAVRKGLLLVDNAGAYVPNSIDPPSVSNVRFLDGAIVADWTGAPKAECWTPPDFATFSEGTYTLKNATDACTATLGLAPVEVRTNANGRLWADGRELSQVHTLDAAGNVGTITGNSLADLARINAGNATGLLLVDDAGAYKPPITPGPVSRVRFQNSSIVADWTEAPAPPECWTSAHDAKSVAGTYMLKNATTTCTAALGLPPVTVWAEADGSLSVDGRQLSHVHTLDAVGKLDTITGEAFADLATTTSAVDKGLLVVDDAGAYAPDAIQPALSRVAASGAAEFSIDVTGQVTRNEQPQKDRTVAFLENPDDPKAASGDMLFVRLYADSSRRPAGDNAKVEQEGTMLPSQRLRLPEHLPSGMDLWRIEVYALGRADKGNSLSGRVYAKNPPQNSDTSAKSTAAGSLQCSGTGTGTNAKDLAKVARDERNAARSAATDAVAKIAMATAAPGGGNDAATKTDIQDAATDALQAAAHDRTASQAAGLARACVDATSDAAARAAAASRSTLAREAADAAHVEALRASSAVWGNHQDCFSLFGIFELPATAPDHTIELSFGTQAPTASTTPTIHRDSWVSAWATHVTSKTKPAFAWKVVGNTATDLPTVLVQVLADIESPKPPLGAYSALIEGTGNQAVTTSQGKLVRGQPYFCATPGQLASYRSVVQTSKALSGGLVAGRAYTVTASVSPTSSDGTWTVSRATSGEAGSYEVKGPKLQVTTASSPASDPTTSNKVQAQFDSPPGWGWTLITGIAWDWDTETTNLWPLGNVFSPSSGAFPSYQWRPTYNTGAAQEVYTLDNAFQPLQRIAFPLLLAGLIPECSWGRFGAGLGPTLLWGSGTNGTVQEWLADLLWSPPWWDSTVDKLYVMAGGGFRFVPDLVGDTQGETISVPRTNGSAPLPPGPTTRSRVAGVVSIGLGFDLALIGKAVQSVTGTGSSSGGK